MQLTRQDYGEEFRYQSLGLPLAVFVREGHPIGQTLTREELGRSPQSACRQTGTTSSYRPLPTAARIPVPRVETSHLLTALEVLRETDFTLVCPAYLARNHGATRDVVASLPNEDAQYVDYALVAHRRTQTSPVHQWLWNEIIDTVRGMRLRTVHRG